MKFMVPSSDEAQAGSLTDEEEAEAEAYARGLGARIDAMAGVYQSDGRDGLITYKDQDQFMGRILAVDAPPRCDTRSSPRKPKSPKTKVGNSWPGMDMVNEDDKSPPHIRKPQRPKTSYKKDIVNDEEDEDEESPPHLRKPQRERPKKGEKVTAAIQIDDDEEEFPHKCTSGRLRSPSVRAKAVVVEVEDDEDEVEESPPRNRRVSRGRQPKAAKAEASVADDEDMEDVVEKSPPRTRGDHRAAAAKRPKARIGEAPRIDPYDEAALYTSYAGLSLNVPNKALDKARMGERMGHRKHK